MMSKRIFLVSFSFVLCCCSIAKAQRDTIKGQLLDSVTKKKVEFANLTIYDANNKPLMSSMSDTNGHFQLIEKEAYAITASSVGYKSKTILLSGHKMLEILLTPDGKTLNEVAITANRQRIKQEIDRLSYDVQADPDSKSQSVLEIMGKVPMLSVDGDENVKLKGNSNYRIFINGRPSSLLANNPKDALKAMPASSVQKIEVITTPPSKYDAEGLSGIINIVTRKQLVDGYTVTVGTSINNTQGTSQTGLLTAKKGKLGVTGHAYVYQDFKRTLNFENDRQSVPYTSLNQLGQYSYVGNYHTEGIELSFEADSLNLLTSSLSILHSRYTDEDRFHSLLYDSPGHLLQSYNSINTNPQLERGVDLDFNYQHGFAGHKDRLLTISYLFHNAPSDLSNNVQISDQYNTGLNSYRQANKSGTKEQTVQLDYIQPEKQFTFDAGVKAIFRNNNSDYHSETLNSMTGTFEDAPDLNNKFNYNQDVYSLYHSWYVKFKSMELKTGIRLEHTEVNGEFAIGDGLHINYTNLIPVISLQRKLKNGSLTFGFTQRILRPGIQQLNPYVDHSNPQFVSTGNPSLKAVLNNNFELAYSAYGQGSYNLSLSYSFSNNNIQQVTNLIDSISYSSYQNVGQNKTAGLNASVSYPVTKKLTATFNSQLSFLWLRGVYAGRFYSNSGPQGFAYTTLNYRLSDTWRATASLTFVSTNLTLQGSTNPYVFNSYRLSKSILNKKLTITGSISNPFSQYRYTRVKTKATDFDQVAISQRLYRTFALSLNYNFGSLKSEIKKNQRSINNDDLLDKEKK